MVDEIARSPSVTEAITHQSVGFADQIADTVRDSSRDADAWLERAARRLVPHRRDRSRANGAPPLRELEGPKENGAAGPPPADDPQMSPSEPRMPEAQAAARALRAGRAAPPPESRVYSEADVAELKYAGLATRTIAFALDAAIINAAAFTTGIAIGLGISLLHLSEQAKIVLGVAMGAGYVIWSVVYFIFFWATSGQTPGDRVMHIRVLDRRAHAPGASRPRDDPLRRPDTRGPAPAGGVPDHALGRPPPMPAGPDRTHDRDRGSTTPAAAPTGHGRDERPPTQAGGVGFPHGEGESEAPAGAVCIGRRAERQGQGSPIGGATLEPRRLRAGGEPRRSGGAARTPGHDAGARARPDSLRTDARLALHLLPGRRADHGCRPGRDSPLGFHGAVLRRCPPVQLRCLRIAGAQTRVRPQRFRRDASRARGSGMSSA